MPYLKQRKKRLAGDGGKMWPFLFFVFFLLAFHFVTSPSVGTQALVRQGEQSHVIGFFPI